MMDTIESGLFKGLPRTWRRGWLEGYLKGILEGLLFQLETKFGSLPPEIVERRERSSPTTNGQADGVTDMPPLPQTLQSAVRGITRPAIFSRPSSSIGRSWPSDPRHVDALHLLGLVALQVGRHDFAVQYISEALQLRPTFAEAHNSLALPCSNRAKPADAAQCHRRALELKPGFRRSPRQHGQRLQGPRQAGRRGGQLSPGSGSEAAPNAEALVNMGHALKELGQPEEAVVQLREALRLNPNIPEAHNNLAQRPEGADEAGGSDCELSGRRSV